MSAMFDESVMRYRLALLTASLTKQARAALFIPPLLCFRFEAAVFPLPPPPSPSSPRQRINRSIFVLPMGALDYRHSPSRLSTYLVRAPHPAASYIRQVCEENDVRATCTLRDRRCSKRNNKKAPTLLAAPVSSFLLASFSSVNVYISERLTMGSRKAARPAALLPRATPKTEVERTGEKSEQSSLGLFFSLFFFLRLFAPDFYR